MIAKYKYRSLLCKIRPNTIHPYIRSYTNR